MKESSVPGEAVVRLTERIREGDGEAFEALAALYRNLTESAVTRFLPSFASEDASRGREDLSQIAALALYRAAITYDPEGKGKTVTFGLYAKICVERALISELRRTRAERGRRERAENAAGAAREGDPLAVLIEAEDSAGLVRRIRSSLAPLERDVFDLYRKGMSVGSIAAQLRCERKSVSNALYRVKAKVRGLLQNPS
ncbi:MAG: sigma-70 family RNA polymerase sigma factor [Clostridia bacterium]|nr:sigma-70 family RNA polymerase sigma factor [Clostridia bacterium]